jgi:flavin-dependent dehydrogenase
MEVCIEGGGPTGLMCAISQYGAGANVSLFEKRNTDYNRVQIVRLDPKTMSWLKFHLPQAYIELFPQNEQAKAILENEKFGIIKPERRHLTKGFYHILYKFLAQNKTAYTALLLLVLNHSYTILSGTPIFYLFLNHSTLNH